MNFRKVTYIAILVVCAIAIITAIVIQIKLKSDENKNVGNTLTEEKTQEELKKEFDYLFNNVINLNNYDTSEIKKFDDSKEIVYTAYQSEAEEDNKYELDVNIPVININENVVTKFNNNTQQIFANKINEILAGTNVYTIYSITYTGYINGDILSVIIKSTLKEGSNPQRTIVQTYNYNLETKEEVTIYDVIDKKGISTQDLNSKINTEITKSINEEKKIQVTGFETYTRDIESDVYKIDNVTTFFIGQDEKLYVIFAYGNNNFTSEMDIIEI